MDREIIVPESSEANEEAEGRTRVDRQARNRRQEIQEAHEGSQYEDDVYCEGHMIFCDRAR